MNIKEYYFNLDKIIDNFLKISKNKEKNINKLKKIKNFNFI